MRKIPIFANIAAIILYALSQGNSANAAEISVLPIESSDASIITVSGEIEAGDEDRFRKVALENDYAWVVLDSPGGALAPALSIGRAIRLLEFTTVVANESVCASSCALIWLSGAKRHLSPGGKVGFHASYYEEDGRLIETGVGNAVVGHYLSQLNLSEKAVIFATSASPHSIIWLNDYSRSQSGIDFEKFEDVEAESPESVSVPQFSASLDQLFTFVVPSECEMSERMLAIFKGLVKFDQSTWEASQGEAIKLPGSDRPITPTFSRNRESGDGYDAREVIATLPISATWLRMRVTEIQYSFFERSSNYEYRIIFDEQPDYVLKTLNKNGFSLKNIGVPKEFHPDAGASYGLALERVAGGAALICGSRMFY